MLKQLVNDLEIKRAYKHARKCRELHMSSPTVCTWNYEVIKEKDNKIVDRGRQLTHSYTRNFHNFLALNSFAYPHSTSLIGTTYEEGSLALKDTSNSMFSNNSSDTVGMYCVQSSGAGSVSAGAGLWGTAGNTAIGIVFGTGDTAESLDDYTMDSIISHSSGVTEYLVQVRGNPSFDVGTRTWSVDWTRTLRNRSGAPITIREVGVRCFLGSNSIPKATQIIRDVLTTPIVVSDNESINFTYRFSYVI